jgi:histidinol dehydrogenase
MNAVPALPFQPAIIDWRALDERERDAVLARPAPLADAKRTNTVRAIIADVRMRGDAALREYSARFDGCAIDRFDVGADEFAAAWSSVPATIRDAMRRAIERIEAFHLAQKSAICVATPRLACAANN